MLLEKQVTFTISGDFPGQTWVLEITAHSHSSLVPMVTRVQILLTAVVKKIQDSSSKYRTQARGSQREPPQDQAFPVSRSVSDDSGFG